jgi:uncharacterized membrane protein YdcZ (DUF606 family)
MYERLRRLDLSVGRALNNRALLLSAGLLGAVLVTLNWLAGSASFLSFVTGTVLLFLVALALIIDRVRETRRR